VGGLGVRYLRLFNSTLLNRTVCFLAAVASVFRTAATGADAFVDIALWCIFFRSCPVVDLDYRGFFHGVYFGGEMPSVTRLFLCVLFFLLCGLSAPCNGLV